MLLLAAPLTAAVVCVFVKGILAKCRIQEFNGRGHPSGHTAVIVALLVVLGASLPKSRFAFAVAVAFGCLYLSDIYLFYVGVKPSVAKDEKPLGHSWQEILTGAVVGGIVGTSFLTVV